MPVYNDMNFAQFLVRHTVFFLFFLKLRLTKMTRSYRKPCNGIHNIPNVYVVVVVVDACKFRNITKQTTVYIYICSNSCCFFLLFSLWLNTVNAHLFLPHSRWFSRFFSRSCLFGSFGMYQHMLRHDRRLGSAHNRSTFE